MSKAAARKDDELVVESGHVHTFTFSTTPPSSSVFSCDYQASIANEVSGNVFINGQAAALMSGSTETGTQTAPLIPPGPGSWDTAPLSTGQATGGSQTVSINGKPALRDGDKANCCAYHGTVQVKQAAQATVFIGD